MPERYIRQRFFIFSPYLSTCGSCSTGDRRCLSTGGKRGIQRRHPLQITGWAACWRLQHFPSGAITDITGSCVKCGADCGVFVPLERLVRLPAREHVHVQALLGNTPLHQSPRRQKHRTNGSVMLIITRVIQASPLYFTETE